LPLKIPRFHRFFEDIEIHGPKISLHPMARRLQAKVGG
jgi:hypothetical protein